MKIVGFGLRSTFLTILVVCVWFSTPVSGQIEMTEFDNQAAEQYLRSLGKISSWPDATWSPESARALDELRAEWHALPKEHQKRTLAKFQKPGNPLHFVDVKALSTLLSQRTRPGRESGAVVSTNAGITFRVHPILRYESVSKQVLPWDWCAPFGSYTDISLELTGDGDVLADFRNQPGGAVYDALQEMVVPFLKENCPASLELFDHRLGPQYRITFSIYLKGIEFHYNTVPSSCPGKGEDQPIRFLVGPGESGEVQLLWGAFQPLTEVTGGLLTRDGLRAFNSAQSMRADCRLHPDPRRGSPFPIGFGE